VEPKSKPAFRILIVVLFAIGSLLISHDFWLLLTPRRGPVFIVLPSVEQTMPVLAVFVTAFFASLGIATAKLPKQPSGRRIAVVGMVVFLIGVLYALMLLLRGLLFSRSPTTLDYPVLLFIIGVGYALILPEIIAEEFPTVEASTERTVERTSVSDSFHSFPSPSLFKLEAPFIEISSGDSGFFSS